MTPTQDDLTVVMDFIAQDTKDFDLTEFMNRWPKQAEAQRIALGMIVARSSREVRHLSKSHARLWVVVLIALGCGTLSLFLQLNFSPIEALGGALASIGCSLIVRVLIS